MLAAQFVIWAKAHPIIVGLGIVVYFMATVSQDRAIRNFVIAAAVLVLLTVLILARAHQYERKKTPPDRSK